MSETRPVYQIRTWTGDPPVKPQGEIFQRYDEPDPDTEPEEVTDDQFLTTTLENILKELNVGIKEIEPLVCEELEERNSKKGKKLVKPSMTTLYKLATSINTILQSRG